MDFKQYTSEACSDVPVHQVNGPGQKSDGPVPEYSITLGLGQKYLVDHNLWKKLRKLRKFYSAWLGLHTYSVFFSHILVNTQAFTYVYAYTIKYRKGGDPSLHFLKKSKCREGSPLLYISWKK